MTRWYALVLAGTLLGGCAAGPQRTPHTDGTALAPDPVALLDELGEAPIGDRRKLAAGNALASREVTVIAAYQAASGRTCRRLVLEAGEQRIICLAENGHWSLQRRIGLSSPGSPTGTIVPATRESGLIGDGQEPAALHDVLGSGETLWAFSRRTTGSGDNWRSIARANDVVDADQMRAGTNLMVPAELVVERIDTAAAGPR